jgi:hypothetical protein
MSSRVLCAACRRFPRPNPTSLSLDEPSFVNGKEGGRRFESGRGLPRNAAGRASHSASMTKPRRSSTAPGRRRFITSLGVRLRSAHPPHKGSRADAGAGARGACRGLRGEASSRQNVPRIARRRGGRRSPRRGRLPGSSAACLRRGAPSRAACGRAWTRRPAGTRRRVLAAGVRELPHGPTSGSDATAASCGPWSRRFMDNRAASD